MTETTKIDFIFRAIDVSGVSMTDFSRMCKSSRTTLYAWKKGESTGDNLRVSLAYETALRLEKAAKLGLLPLKERHKAIERLKVLKKIVNEMGRAT